MTKMESMIQKGAQAGVQCLLAICADEEQKAGDRISAAKALIDYACKSGGADDASTLKVILNGVPKEYLV